MDKKKQLLGLAMRAGKVVSGEENVIRAIRAGRAHLVCLSADASANTGKKLQDKSSYYEIPLITFPSRDELGEAIGKPSRVVVAITDPGFARALLKHT
ncbi:YlxQ family RNA-binding protein [Mechercharimyces sp. CAU 1602]|uniref:YlxQ family RNA-binding protein n=1 Tax=Mechercharimyces sp. CAU 1602 TaxID=2973933 RepID=UPI002161EFFF|nr:YlxQ family RNA-binding protein [Mechercharimyces sp. CAU 1602]MCS1351278.1 YlxQ family RNA-binding protein [Mechercharimyces sp. CAU 1602]